jgi:transcriptional regulator with XRE-family HTH domain
MHAAPGSGNFRDQILLLRGRAGLTQRELAALLGISRPALQKWEAGEGYPTPTRLRALIALYLERGVFMAGREEQEAMALWEALRREAHRTPPFDAAWFAGLCPASPAVAADPAPVKASASIVPPERSEWQAWGEAPAVDRFQGRRAEVETLSRWLLVERCRLVVVLGLGGIGKTALATHTAHDLASHFAGLCWRSLRNAPPARGVARCGHRCPGSDPAGTAGRAAGAAGAAARRAARAALPAGARQPGGGAGAGSGRGTLS